MKGIGHYTAKHFANSPGWPVTLVLMGVAFLGVDTIAIRVKCQFQAGLKSVNGAESQWLFLK